ncbi:MAG: radical SAM protein [Proteobacteria bacterium]|nr:radical SAM protein [Pseudomonadota bacterium]MBU4298282.1 radical SAM protein [Pseudomonadota bacterium]MCG2747551.1 radical SAM protein [Desulfobulbaceae bacterium]
MHYEGMIIRPPSEADSIILQVTVGCSHNKCTFCGTYKDVRFHLKQDDVVDQDIDFAATYCKRQKRVFLADGDALIIPQRRLVDLLTRIRIKIPWVNRISLYGNAKSVLLKSAEELQELKSLGLDRVYMGLESGADRILQNIRKGADAAKMIRAGQRVKEAGLFLSLTVLLGIGGTEFSREHAVETGRVVSAMSANQIAVLTLMLLPNTGLYRLEKSGQFTLPNQMEMLHELRLMVENISISRAQFQANHASNYLPINCRLSRDKEMVLAAIDQALNGEKRLTPEYLRAL